MRNFIQLAWQRFNIISAIVGDVSGSVIAVLFYFTIFAPFGIISRLFSDPLRRKPNETWLDRDPVAEDMNSARLQG